MRVQNAKFGHRILALCLAIVMVIGMLPGSVFAAGNNAVAFTVKDGDGNLISGATVTCTFAKSNGDQIKSEQTEDGEAEIKVEGPAHDVTSVSYEIVKEGYITVTGQASMGQDVAVTMTESKVVLNVTGAENAYVEYQINGEGETLTADVVDGTVTIDLADTDTKIVGSVKADGYASIVGEVANGQTMDLTMVKAEVTVNVTDETGAAAAGAQVTWNITGKGDSYTATADANGSVVIDLNGLDVTSDDTVTYAIDKDGADADHDGYKTAEGKVPVGETADVRLEKITHTVNATVVDADGVGMQGIVVTCIIDGAEVGTGTTDANGKVSYTIEGCENPENVSCKATVGTVTHVAMCTTSGSTSTGEIKATDLVTLTVAITGNGTVTINGTDYADGDKVLVGIDESVTISASAADDTIRLESLKVGENTFASGSITTFAAGTTVSAVFVQTYTVTVSYDAAQGTAEILDGDASYGTITVDEGKEGLKLHVTSNTAEGYEIASVTGFDNVEGQTDVTLDIPKVESNVTIEVTFQLMTYDVTVSNNANYGTATVSGLNEDNTVTHGNGITISVEPTAFAVFAGATVNGTEYTVDDFTMNGSVYVLTIEAITGPVAIETKYDTMGVAEVGAVTITPDNADDLLRTDGNVFIYKPGTRVAISADAVLRLEQINGYSSSFVAGGVKRGYETTEQTPDGNAQIDYDYVWNTPIYVTGPKYTVDTTDAAYGVNTGVTGTMYGEGDYKWGWKYTGDKEYAYTVYEFNGAEYRIVAETENWNLIHNGDLLVTNGNGHGNYALKIVTYTDGYGWSWNTLGSADAPFGIVFDVTAPTITSCEPDVAANGAGYHSSDVTFAVKASEEDGYYSGMASIEYYITTAEVADVSTITGWTVATMPVGGEQTGEASFTVKAEDYNAENVYVYVKATDAAGNSTAQLEEILHICTDEPTVVITDVTGTVDTDGIEPNYNCTERVATVTVTDRADTTLENVVFTVNGQTHESKITWGETADENGNLTGTATYTFTAEGAYEWSVSYTNKADLSASVDGDAFVIDRTAPAAADMTVLNVPESGIFNTDTVTVQVDVTDVTETGVPMIGINTVTYEVKCDGVTTQNGTLYTCNGGAVRNDYSGEITVNADKNNSCNVVVYVTVTDNAGNAETFESQVIDIDRTAPVVNISFDNNAAENDTYFDATRTATIRVTDRVGHIQADKVELVITAVDAEGNQIEVPQLSGWSYEGEDPGHDGSEMTYVATIEFLADANYTFSFAVTDEAGNKNEGIIYADGTVAPEAFTVDTTKPTGTIYADSVIVSLDENGQAVENVTNSDWNALIETLTFGIWSNDTITVYGDSDDVTSDIWKVEFYKDNGTVALTEDELAAKTWTAVEELVIETVTPETEGEAAYHITTYDVSSHSGNEKFTVYLKITDMAGNVTYISTNGMIVDDKEPTGEQPTDGDKTVGEITIGIPAGNANNIHTESISLGVSVVDPMFSGEEAIEGGSFAGLKTITYTITATDTGASETGTLFDGTSTEGAVYDETTGLCFSWTGSLPIDAAVFNSNHVIVKIVAVDNAGNVQTTTTLDGEIMIDTTDPTIHISYDNNTPDSGSYYKADRTATITVTERNFNPEAVIATITNTDGVIPELIGWTTYPGADGGNGDDATHVATIVYHADGDYTFAIECTDLADRVCTNDEVTYADGTQNPTEFTIDQTAPVISVSYSNNSAANGKYFAASRTATITITEHNFSEERVTFTRTADRGGQLPSISWRHSGDTHVATIVYSVDGDYTFDVTMTDLAGNESGAANYGSSVAGKDFVLDTTYADMITITGVENGAAYGYSDTVVPVIAIADINLDTHEVTLVGVQKDKVIDLTAQVNELLQVGSENVDGTLDLFEVIQDLDGIYTLSVTAADMAGNVDTEQIVFTVNRYGSVYVYGEYLSQLIADGGSYVTSVDQDLVITEYNADKLLAGSLVIEITRDGKPLDNVIYTVSPEINENVQPGSSGWYQYAYTISAENFAADGVYKISVSSEDATGNTPENTNYEDMGITFRVDSTQAEITSIVGLEEPIINATEVEVQYTIFDTIGLKSVKIYVDGELVDEVTDFSGDMNNYSGSFILTEDKTAQSVRLVVEDMSGNITDTDAEDFSSAYEFNKSVTVSTNIFVRWYANKALFWGSIVGGVGVAGFLWFFLFGKRKKEEEEQPAK